MNKKRSGYVILVGLRSSIIEYSKETLSWQLVEQTHNTTATAEAQSCQRHIAKVYTVLGEDYGLLRKW